MSSNDQTNPIDKLQERLDADWNMITKARANAVAKRKQLSAALPGLDSDDSSIVVFGSLARDEFTSGSDIDWTLLVDGFASPEHLDSALEISRHISEVEKKSPGQEGTFGGLSFSHDLIHLIGGSDDTNRNTTQRILLLLESAALDRSEAHERVTRNILLRYVLEDYGLVHSAGRFRVPHFLQNDIARYWRTLAVDFAYKQRKRSDEGWALRVTKLQMSRKLTYVSGLLMCFSCEFDRPRPLDVGDESSAPDPHDIVEHLWEYSKKTSLEIVAHTLLLYPQLDDVARKLFGAYNEYLELLDDENSRKRLKELARSEVGSDKTYQRVRELSLMFQDSLTTIFLEEDSTPLLELTKTYGVF